MFSFPESRAAQLRAWAVLGSSSLTALPVRWGAGIRHCLSPTRRSEGDLTSGGFIMLIVCFPPRVGQRVRRGRCGQEGIDSSGKQRLRGLKPEASSPCPSRLIQGCGSLWASPQPSPLSCGSQDSPSPPQSLAGHRLLCALFQAVLLLFSPVLAPPQKEALGIS